MRSLAFDLNWILKLNSVFINQTRRNLNVVVISTFKCALHHESYALNKIKLYVENNKMVQHQIGWVNFIESLKRFSKSFQNDENERKEEEKNSNKIKSKIYYRKIVNKMIEIYILLHDNLCIITKYILNEFERKTKWKTQDTCWWNIQK